MSNTPTRLIALAATAILAAAGAVAAEPETTDPDAWTGKSRPEIVQLLGEPDKTKTDREGVETLTYKFYRVDPDAPPGPAALLIHVPGVGLVARVDKDLTRDADPMQINPTVLDEQGRRVSGGASPSRSASSTWDKQHKIGGGETTQPWEGPDNPAIKGKATVKFVLDTDGRVVEWSAPGKKKQ
jgi:hypothetical protein